MQAGERFLKDWTRSMFSKTLASFFCRSEARQLTSVIRPVHFAAGQRAAVSSRALLVSCESTITSSAFRELDSSCRALASGRPVRLTVHWPALYPIHTRPVKLASAPPVYWSRAGVARPARQRKTSKNIKLILFTGNNYYAHIESCSQNSLCRLF